MILCSNPGAQYLAYRDEIDTAMRRVLESGVYINGPELDVFEKEFAAYTEVNHAVGVANGTDALSLTLKAFGVGPGDEVITVSHTAQATISAIFLAGATPVVIDVEPDFYTLDPALLKNAISTKTRAIVVVHLYGQCVEMMTVLKEAKERGIVVIEDCAQATGAIYSGRKAGSFGDAGCFSFYPTKNLGALGDAGMIVTRNDDVAKKLRELREYGWDTLRLSQCEGQNSRLDEIQAAILQAKLPFLDGDNLIRQKIAAFYHDQLRETPLKLPRVRSNGSHVFHLYVVQCKERDVLHQHLKKVGILCGIHYPVPLHLQAGNRKMRKGSDLEVTEWLARHILSLPMYPQLTQQEQEHVVNSILEFYN